MLLLLIGFLLAGGCTASSNDAAQQSLTIYTARDKDEVAHVVSLFTAKYPKYKAGVNIITLGAQAALDRLRAEKSNPQAGFLWGGTLQALQQAAHEDLLAPSSPANANLIDGSRRDSRGTRATRLSRRLRFPDVRVKEKTCRRERPTIIAR